MIFSRFLSAVFLSVVLKAVHVTSQAVLTAPSTLIECQPAALSWSNATGTVYLSVVEGSDISGTRLETFPDQTGSSGTYTIE